jgi:hypothetical protein
MCKTLSLEMIEPCATYNESKSPVPSFVSVSLLVTSGLESDLSNTVPIDNFSRGLLFSSWCRSKNWFGY